MICDAGQVFAPLGTSVSRSAQQWGNFGWAGDVETAETDNEAMDGKQIRIILTNCAQSLWGQTGVLGALSPPPQPCGTVAKQQIKTFNAS